MALPKQRSPQTNLTKKASQPQGHGMKGKISPGPASKLFNPVDTSKAMSIGSADRFCGTKNSGKLRVSGGAGAHQVGKR